MIEHYRLVIETSSRIMDAVYARDKGELLEKDLVGIVEAEILKVIYALKK